VRISKGSPLEGAELLLCEDSLRFEGKSSSSLAWLRAVPYTKEKLLLCEVDRRNGLAEMAVDCEQSSKHVLLGKSCPQRNYAQQTVLSPNSVVAFNHYRPKREIVQQEKYSALASKTPTAFTKHILRGTSWHGKQKSLTRWTVALHNCYTMEKRLWISHSNRIRWQIYTCWL